MPFENSVIKNVHPFQNIGLEILFAALPANSGCDVAKDHEVLFPAVVLVDRLLDHFSSTVAAIGVKVHDRPPRVLGSLHFGAVGV